MFSAFNYTNKASLPEHFIKNLFGRLKVKINVILIKHHKHLGMNYKNYLQAYTNFSLKNTKNDMLTKNNNKKKRKEIKI